MAITIFHNPKCGTSRTVLGLLREAGIEPTIIEYLKTPPGRDGLVKLLRQMKVGPREILREKEAAYQNIGAKGPTLSDDELLDLMVEHPILMNRPIVVSPKGAKLCRPAEVVQELL